jgi:hypothetical protein
MLPLTSCKNQPHYGAPMAKYRALVPNCPQGICSIPQPAFTFLCQFSLSPR